MARGSGNVTKRVVFNNIMSLTQVAYNTMTCEVLTSYMLHIILKTNTSLMFFQSFGSPNYLAK